MVWVRMRSNNTRRIRSSISVSIGLGLGLGLGTGDDYISIRVYQNRILAPVQLIAFAFTFASWD